jgi:hypothetical protein
VQKVVDGFLADPLRSKPLGFYTWSPELTAIFRQDRLLQTGLELAAAEAIRLALDRDPACRDTHDVYRRLIARLTNSPFGPSVRPVAGVPDGPERPDAPGQSFLFPASRSHEQELLEQLYAGKVIPDEFDLLAELIRRIRGRQIRLGPTGTSGWYDYQAWSLKPLIEPDPLPESSRLSLSGRYRKHLEDLFRAGLALARETHVKNAGGGRGGYGGGPPRRIIYVGPDLTVEPLPSVYRRRAEGYRFVRSVLEEAFGAAAVAGMRRLTPNGPVDLGLSDELREVELLFSGAALTACRELGLRADVAEAEAGAIDRFAAWLRGAEHDPDVGRDARMMTPIYYDVGRRKIKVWAFLGWRQVPLSVEYKSSPPVVSVEPETSPPEDRPGVLRQKFRPSPEQTGASQRPEVVFTGDSYSLATPVMAEVYVSQLLDRDEFRRHCNRHRTREKILATLR